MKIIEEEIKELLPTGVKIILDPEFVLPTDEEVLASVTNFIQYRQLFSALKSLLDAPNFVPLNDVLATATTNLRAVKEFDFVQSSHDCDNAAVELLAWMSGKGWPFAMAVLEGHAVCLYINSNKVLRYIDPQTGQLMTTDKRLKVTVML